MMRVSGRPGFQILYTACRPKQTEQSRLLFPFVSIIGCARSQRGGRKVTKATQNNSVCPAAINRKWWSFWLFGGFFKKHILITIFAITSGRRGWILIIKHRGSEEELHTSHPSEGTVARLDYQQGKDSKCPRAAEFQRSLEALSTYCVLTGLL